MDLPGRHRMAFDTATATGAGEAAGFALTAPTPIDPHQCGKGRRAAL